ncbi:bifunctional diguanylate cyclase/phosphodiesterase [Rhodoferax sp.]|uniref:putative bifunctional diguanylate cyclase/phosphodiesterase n=1 Tax=Rhodoferax sp. TaxID=50421 RepID=UPI0025FB5D56|nr:bifunctional diguanylate cyclase/phosphodiesterase [Rhodoferax sp.]
MNTLTRIAVRVRESLGHLLVGGRHAHIRVRVAMYGVLLLLLLLGMFRAVLSLQWQADRQVDLQLLQTVAEQRVLVGRLSLLLPDGSHEVSEGQRQDLRLSSARLRNETEVAEALLQTQTATAPLESAEVLAAFREWASVRRALWVPLDAVQIPGASVQTVEVAELRQALQRAESALYGLARELTAETAQRSRRLIGTVWAIATGILILALTLAMLVVEPTARAVRRQYQELTRQAERLKRMATVAEISSNAIAITDAGLRVVWVNQAFSALTGHSDEQACGRRIGTLLKGRSADPTHFTEFTESLIRGRGIKREVRIVTKKGELGWVLLDMQPISEPDGAVSGWVMVATDLSEVRSQQEILSLAVSGAGLGIWHWDLVDQSVGWNRRMQQILGYPDGVLVPHASTWRSLIHPEDLSAWEQSVRMHLQDESREHRLSVRLRHYSGRWVWILFAGRAADRTVQGRVLRIAGVAMDVNAQKALEQQLRTAARTDDLTALPNRTEMVEMIRAAIERRRQEPGYHFAVLFMDFDRFKQVNDTLGHTVGDALLRQIARRLEESLRPGDAFVQADDFEKVAARIGGDEFVVLLDDIRGDLDAIHVAGRLLDVLAVPYQVEGHRVTSTVSIGIVTSLHAQADADSVLRDADIAMYEAKRTGRARYVVFDPAMRSELSDSVALENDLREALGKHEMSVVYQPLVRLPGYELAGMEALVRWRHPVRGPVSPVDFIPLAESCGLIAALGQFVLEESCLAFEKLQRVLGPEAPPSVSVNLSRAQLREPGLVELVRDALRNAHMEPHQLVLEVTESLAAQDALVQSTLQALRAMGVALSLDDFGTGYSSLACLHELPVHSIKIDRSFVSLLDQSEYHRVLIEATLKVAATLQLGTVAEGIETEAQARQMADLGCEKAQGYWIARPMPLNELVSWIQGRPKQEHLW